MYLTEQELVQAFLTHLLCDNPWKASEYDVEFNYLRGKTDIVTISSDDSVIAIEAKLTKWRTALQQAFRNRCFADESYVLLPPDVAAFASRYEYEFERRGVGICTLVDDHIAILVEATTEAPPQPWLRELAIQYVQAGESAHAKEM